MDERLLGERIAQARGDLDLTQEHLAKRVGIDRTALSRIEKGQRKVSAAELVELASTLGVSLAWFVRDPLPAVVSRRTDAAPGHESTARLDRELELFAGDVAALLSAGVVAAASKPILRTPRDHEEAERAAEAIRSRLGVGNGPLTRIAAMAEDLGLYSCVLPLGDGGADGAMVEVGAGVAAAVIDGDTRSGRRRMSLAHEFGHWVFGDSYDQGAVDTEKMINSFAVHLLAPRAGVIELWNRYRAEPVRDRAIRVAAAYRVSWSAAVSQLRNIDLIDADMHRSLVRRVPVRGEFARLAIDWGAEELQAPSLSPQMTAGILEAYVDRRLSAGRVIELLRGALDFDDLPEQRAESAADFANL